MVVDSGPLEELTHLVISDGIEQIEAFFFVALRMLS
jgi:hypothetical protein